MSKVNESRQRMKKAVQHLQECMMRYDKQIWYLDYTDETLIDDVLYELGVALDPKRYAFAQGFRRFKKRLVKHLADKEINCE